MQHSSVFECLQRILTLSVLYFLCCLCSAGAWVQLQRGLVGARGVDVCAADWPPAVQQPQDG